MLNLFIFIIFTAFTSNQALANSCTCDLIVESDFEIPHSKENLKFFDDKNDKTQFGSITLSQTKNGAYQCRGSKSGIAAEPNTQCYSFAFSKLTTGTHYTALKKDYESCIHYVKKLTKKINFTGAFKDKSPFGTELNCTPAENTDKYPHPFHDTIENQEDPKPKAKPAR